MGRNVSYPNNLLRNVARASLDADYTLVIDIDMLPSQNLHDEFLNFLKRRAPRPDEVFVVPAFEIRHTRKIPATKTELLQLYQACELHVAGYSFSVLSSAFLVHRGFKVSREFHARKDEENRLNRVLFRQFKEGLKLKYQDSTRRC
ncbi:UNVERIFIED_CONTAM: hypothetical protein FKN15_028771 [Acipenser sinensis]